METPPWGGGGVSEISGIKEKITEISGIKENSKKHKGNSAEIRRIKDCAPQARNLGILALKFANFFKILIAKTQKFSRLRRTFSLILLN